MRRDYNNMCRQRCEDCVSYDTSDTFVETEVGTGYCVENSDVVSASDGEFCEDFESDGGYDHNCD